MGQSVLANQLVSGLRADIKAKVAGSEGGFDHFLAKVRFKEDKLRDLIGHGSRSSVPPTPRPLSNTTQPHQMWQKQGVKDFKPGSKPNQGIYPGAIIVGPQAI